VTLSASRLRTLALILLTAAACLVLRAAYPFGILWADTQGYVSHGTSFSLLEANDQDWRHMPVFSLMLRASLLLSHPVDLLFWTNAALFLGIILMVRCIAARVTGLDRLGFLCALLVLAGEIALMNTFFFVANLLADTPYALLLLLGSLLALDGWASRKTAPTAVGFVLVGLTALIKPAAMSIIPLWSIFAVWIGIETWMLGKSAKTSFAKAALYAGLVLLPLSLWSARNALLYDDARPSSFLSRNILARVLPLVRDGDRLLSSADDDERFLRDLRAYEKNIGTGYNDYFSDGVRNGYPGPINALMRLMPGGTGSYLTDFPQRFDQFGIRVALRIIAQHPAEYAAMAGGGYAKLFQPWVKDHAGPIRAASSRERYFSRYPSDFAPEWELKLLYPPDGRIRPTDANFVADQALRLSDPLRATLLRKTVRRSFTVLIHVIAAAAIWILWRSRRSLTERRPLTVLAVITLLLFGNAFCNYLLATLVELPLERYQLSASMGLNVLYALWAIVAVRTGAAAMPWRKSKAR
jgi:hypothetical protein